jgi:hypothetical protein
VLGVGLLDERLVLVGVERLPERGDRLDAVLGQGGQQLLVDQLEPLADPRGGRGTERLGGTLEVVEAVEQVARQRAIAYCRSASACDLDRFW